MNNLEDESLKPLGVEKSDNLPGTRVFLSDLSVGVSFAWTRVGKCPIVKHYPTIGVTVSNKT